MADNARVSGHRTLTGMLKKAVAEFPDRRALALSGKYKLTHGRLDALVNQAADRLLRLGVRCAYIQTILF